MNIIGIQAFYYSHATALIKDGKLDFFIEDEKISRIKSQREGFPTESLIAALKNGELRLDDIQEIAYPVNPWSYTWNVTKQALIHFWQSATRPHFTRHSKGEGEISLLPDRILVCLKYTPPFIKNLIRSNVRFNGIPGKMPQIQLVPHHLAHANSAFFTSGMEEAAILIVDGLGETESTSIWTGKDLSIRSLEKVGFPNSLGEFYAAFTEFCGFKTYSQEGKLMGLAAYGSPNREIQEKMSQVIRIDEERYHVAPKYTVRGRHTFSPAFSDDMVSLFGQPRRRGEPLTDFHRDLAFAAQDALEKAVLELVKRATRITGSRNLCFSGGVAMNCKLNGAILHSGLVDRFSVLPASNDAGAALGAAMARSAAHGEDPRFELKHTYYGPSFSDDEIEAALRNAKVPYRRIGISGSADGLDEVADLLISGKVIGLYTGRCEFGARALGARSILADPRDPGMWEVVNSKVKHREKWRPFAPVILEGHEPDYFINGRPSYYMMEAFHILPDKRSKVPAIVHVDGTCRPQSISKEINPTYFGILNSFYRKTGVPVLMNTSFNIKDEPIVAKPADALRCYLGTGLDALLIGPFLLDKDGLEIARGDAPFLRRAEAKEPYPIGAQL